MLARAAAAEATLFDLAGLECGSLSIAASQTVGNYWLPPILHRYRRLYPKIAIELKICNTLTAADMARAGVVDFAIVEGEICDTSLAIEPVARDELKLVTFPGHPWTQAKPKLADDYRSANWVLREKGSGTRAIFEAVLGQFGVDAAELRIALELPTHEAVAAAVAAAPASPCFRASSPRLPPGPWRRSTFPCQIADFSPCGAKAATSPMPRRPFARSCSPARPKSRAGARRILSRAPTRRRSDVPVVRRSAEQLRQLVHDDEEEGEHRANSQQSFHDTAGIARLHGSRSVFVCDGWTVAEPKIALNRQDSGADGSKRSPGAPSLTERARPEEAAGGPRKRAIMPNGGVQ